MKKFELQSGNEIRGFKIRLYPDKETEEKLEILERDLRRAWNWLCAQTEEVLQARVAYAIRQGLVGLRPTRPDYVGLSPEASKLRKEKYLVDCREWYGAVYKTTSKVAGCEFRKTKDLIEHFGFKYDYQLLGRVIEWGYDEGAERVIEPGAHMLQALSKNYHQTAKGARRKRFRRAFDPMPLQVRSGSCFELGDFGRRGTSHDSGGKSFYNCRITMNGLRIRGRLPGKSPEGRVLEGVSIRREADGWWASIKQEVPIRNPPEAVLGSIVGIDVGLDYMAAMSDGRRVSNARGKAYAERIAGRQAQGLSVGRLQCSAARHNRHVIYNEVVKPLATVETIKVEKLTPKIGQMGSSKASSMRSIVKVLRERYGDRVREVEPHYTSQDCSQCGHRSKESWSYANGRFGKCPACGYSEDRDVNAARNIARKEVILLATDTTA